MLEVYFHFFKHNIELIQVLDLHHWLQVTYNKLFLRNNASYIKNHKCSITMAHSGPGEITPSYILHTHAFGTYLLGGLFTLQKDYKVMVFYM
jgi:hypothetical protein